MIEILLQCSHWLAGTLAVGLLVLWLLVELLVAGMPMVELLAAGIPMAVVALKPLIELLLAAG